MIPADHAPTHHLVRLVAARHVRVFAFFSLAAFSTESWPLAQRDGILTELVLRQRFTVNWDIGGDTWWG